MGESQKPSSSRGELHANDHQLTTINLTKIINLTASQRSTNLITQLIHLTHEPRTPKPEKFKLIPTHNHQSTSSIERTTYN